MMLQTLIDTDADEESVSWLPAFCAGITNEITIVGLIW